MDINLYWLDYTSSDFTVTLTLTIGETVHSFIKRTRNLSQKIKGWGWSSLISHDDLFDESQNFIVDDVLTLEFQVTIVDKPTLPNIH